MSGDFPFPTKTVSPVKCNEKPWDVWIGEIGYRSPRREEESGKPERRRRGGRGRLRHDAMSLHGLLPQMDTLDAAVCHLCGSVVKCSAAYRHLRDAHSAAEPLLPPPPAPAPAAKPRATPSRSRHKKEPPPPPPPEAPPEPEASPAPPDPRHPPEPSPAAFAAELQVGVDGGDLPVVSIQMPEDLPLDENLTDEILEIMNSEGIQSADDITNAEDWNNIIKDIGNMQEINFPSVADPVSTVDPYAALDVPMVAYAPPEPEAATLRFAPEASPARPAAPDSAALAARPPEPVTPSTKSEGRRRSGKPKFNVREYDPNKHCGVLTGDIPKPCTRSLTCKAHALSLRRAVEGRAKPFDALLAEHRAAREAAHAPPPAPADLPPAPALAARAPSERPAGLAGDEPCAEEAAPPDASAPDEEAEDGVCWYAAVPRPLALCTYNAALAGGAVAAGRRHAAARGPLKAALARPGKAARGARRPELRRLVAACGVAPALGALLADARLNGHAARARLKPPAHAHAKRAALELGFALDPLLADEKC